MHSSDEPRSLLEHAQLIHSAASVQEAINQVADQLNHDLKDARPLVLSVMNGALMFSGHLLAKLEFPLQTDYVEVSRYHEKTEGKQLIWRTSPRVSLRDKVVLVVDDILDEGYTLAAIKKFCMEAGACKVLVVVLAEKILQRDKPIQADYVGLRVPNQYVFGFGMDVYGWWRNLPAIYALE